MGRKERKPDDIWHIISLEPMIHDRQMCQINGQMCQINGQMRQYTVPDLYQ
jgi:hypothetical protein